MHTIILKFSLFIILYCSSEIFATKPFNHPSVTSNRASSDFNYPESREAAITSNETDTKSPSKIPQTPTPYEDITDEGKPHLGPELAVKPIRPFTTEKNFETTTHSTFKHIPTSISTIASNSTGSTEKYTKIHTTPSSTINSILNNRTSSNETASAPLTPTTVDENIGNSTETPGLREGHKNTTVTTTITSTTTQKPPQPKVTKSPSVPVGTKNFHKSGAAGTSYKSTSVLISSIVLMLFQI